MFHNFLNSYTVADKVQLVKFAEYYSANVVDTVKAASWNNTNGTGGVIALSVFQDLILNAPVYADGLGFKGGTYILSEGNCSNLFASTGYTYDASVTSPLQQGASKGEGVFNVTLPAQASLTGGRGAPANGGGGGNSHNNAGGGGANLSAAGIGGGNSSSGGCTTELHGLGGKPLKNWNGKKIFFGGGGGTGHSDGTPAALMGGGNGGGIVIIISETLIGNGYTISANGAKGGDAISDGASGGGAGGTIIMSVNNYTGSSIIEAKGGAGGDENDLGTPKRCYGAGGGGSGGAIYFTGSVPAVSISVTGGLAGLEYGGDPLCNPPVLPTNGSNGTTISPYTIRQATDSASYCLSIAPLPVRLIYFKAMVDESSVQLKWRVTNPELAEKFILEKIVANSWSSFNIMQADPLIENYNYTDEHPEPGINLYRLKIIQKDNSFFYSPVYQVLLSMNSDDFVIHPNPATNQISIIGQFSPIETMRLFDASGKLFLQKKLIISGNSILIDLPPLHNAVYMLQIGSAIKKLVIR
jgi:hypothetical protein